MFITASKYLLQGVFPDYKDALRLKKQGCKLGDTQGEHDSFSMINVCTCIGLLQFKSFMMFVKLCLSTFNINCHSHGNLKVIEVLP